MHHVRIAQTGPNRAVIEIDGMDVHRAVRGYTVTATVGELPVVVFDLVVMPLNVEGPADVYVAPESRDLLIAMGWTPPGPPETGETCADCITGPDGQPICAPTYDSVCLRHEG